MQFIGAHNCEIKVTMTVCLVLSLVFNVDKKRLTSVFGYISTDIKLLFPWENNTELLFSLSDISLHIWKQTNESIVQTYVVPKLK